MRRYAFSDSDGLFHSIRNRLVVPIEFFLRRILVKNSIFIRYRRRGIDL